MKRLLLVLALLVAPAAARAHDTYLLAPAGPFPAGAALALSLTSGTTFPGLEYGPKPDRVASVAASSGVLIVRGRTEEALQLRLASPAPGLQVAAVTLKPHTLTLSPGELAHYLDEIAATPEVRAAAAKANGWRETYVKFAKALICIETCTLTPAAARPVGAALEFVTEPSLRRFVLLHQGRPLAAQPVAVQWAGERVTLTTDAQGALDLPAGAAGPVLLSTTRLVPPLRNGAPWTSDFATLTLTIAR